MAEGFQAVGRNFSQVLSSQQKDFSELQGGSIWGEAGWGNITCPDLFPVQDFSLYIIFILWNFFGHQDISVFEITYQLLTLDKKKTTVICPKE